MGIADCRIIELPKISDFRGHLTFVETATHIPFKIARVYYMYGVPGDIGRAGHAHKHLDQLLIAVAGNFNITIDDGVEKKTFHLSKPNEGLFLDSMIWREMKDFSEGTVCLVLASKPYDESDYYRNYQDFINAAREHHDYLIS